MEKPKRRPGMDLTEGGIFKLLAIFCFPMLLTSLVQQLYNLVDLIVIGQFVGSHGTVGVSTGGQITSVLTMLCAAFTGGCQVYISQLVGAGDKDKIKHTVATILTFMELMAFVFMIFAFALHRPLLRLMNTPAEAMEQAADYMSICCFGLPFIFGYNEICAILRGIGESKRPLIFVVVAAVANIFMDLFCVLVLKMESAGTAVATVAAQFASFAASAVYLYMKRDAFDFDFKLKSFKIHKEPLKVIIKLGIPKALQQVLIQFTMLYCNSLINSYGMAASAVNGIGQKVLNFCNIITMSVDNGAAIIVGQNLGARKLDRVKKTVYTALKCTMVMFVLNTILFLTVPELLLGIFSSDPEVIELGVSFLRISIITMFLAYIAGPFQAVVTGSGFAMLSLVTGILDGIVLRLGFSFLLAYVFDLGVYGFYMGNALARLGPMIMSSAYFFSGKWQTRKLLTEQK